MYSSGAHPLRSLEHPHELIISVQFWLKPPIIAASSSSQRPLCNWRKDPAGVRLESRRYFSNCSMPGRRFPATCRHTRPLNEKSGRGRSASLSGQRLRSPPVVRCLCLSYRWSGAGGGISGRSARVKAVLLRLLDARKAISCDLLPHTSTQ